MTTPPSNQEALAHQTFQNFPLISMPMVDPQTGLINRPWLQFLLAVNNSLGPSSLAAVESMFDINQGF